MTKERMVTGIEVTHSCEPYCDQLMVLLEKTINNGVDIKEVIGDMVYVSEYTPDVCEKKWF